jgi:CRP/FNR family transcriptional regulator, cyclic AMP receptor protein
MHALNRSSTISRYNVSIANSSKIWASSDRSDAFGHGFAEFSRRPRATPQALRETVPDRAAPSDTLQPRSKLSARQLSKMAPYGVVRNYPKNTILMNEEAESAALYVILGGVVKMYMSDECGKEFIMTILGAGDCFGEVELLDTGPAMASAVTLEQSQICVISKESFQRSLVQHDGMAFELLVALSRRVRGLTRDVKSFALEGVYGRVVRILHNLASEKDGRLVIQQRLTQREIAEMVGASREMVGRILKGLSDGGYILVSKRQIVIQARFPRNW